MELVARRGERSAEERCPYCHDALASAPDAVADDVVACPGCATQHHRACVEELGRCTIRGCERALVAEPEADPLAGRLRRSSVTEEVRRRLRARVRHFVSEHATPVPDGPPHVRYAAPDATAPPPVGRLLGEPPPPRAAAIPPPPVPPPPAREEPRPVPRDPAFAARLRDAQRAARNAPLAERAGHCRLAAELLRLPPAVHEAAHPEATARNYELRAEELERLAVHASRAGAGLPLWAVGVVVGLLLALLMTLTYLASR